MKFITSTGILLDHISPIQGIIPSNPILPILENFLFKIKDGMLSIVASDFQTFIVTTLSVDTEEEISIAVPAKILTETLRNSPEQPITFELDLSNYTINIHCENAFYKLSGENAEDYPEIPDLGESQELNISSEVLANGINYTLFSVSNDEIKPAMNGVLISFRSSYTDFVASDSHRLVRYRRTDLSNERENDMIIPKKSFSLLKKILPSGNLPIKLAFNDANAIFTFENYQLVCRLIDERFPDYENVIPLNNENSITLDRVELMNRLKRIAIYSNRSTHQIKFEISGDNLQISTQDSDLSNEGKETLLCEHSGENIEIGFNARFLIEILNNLHKEKVIFRLAKSNSAVLILPSEDEENENIIMLIMPIMLQ